ncbi:Vitamin B6 transporter [Sporothrix curviconia]|uniref:Vitamin B6 transporter n=1 Tax=Sporothrix curviconia TaxID=1260050 RepID=A0ABP0BQP6_9PEZI
MDAEKQLPSDPESVRDVEQGTVEIETVTPQAGLLGRVLRLEKKLGFEARGIERVPEALRDRQATFADYAQMSVIWFSSNITANNIMVGLLGPLLFGVGLVDAMVLGALGAMLGALGTAYLGTFGPMAGCRTMVVSRYTMGWWPNKICVLLNLVIELGYGLVDALLAGQILSAVNGGGMSVIVGVIIATVIVLAVCLLGIRMFHLYERYAFVPQLAVLFVLVGVAGPSWDVSSPTVGAAPDRAADRMSFFFLCVSGSLAWAGSGADFFVYFPPNAQRSKVFLSTTVGLGLSCAMTYLLGVGIGSGALTNAAWNDAYNVSVGALLVEVYRPLGSFGDFCAVVVALGIIGNNVPTIYSAGLNFQLLGRWCMAVPRSVWTLLSVVIYTVCACAGRNELFTVFQNFLALMGYWVAMWLALIVEDELLFRRQRDGRSYDWSVWNERDKLPVGLAALAAFCVGWAGAVLGMYQSYFTGPLARLVGDGIDLGIPVGMSWSALVYPPLWWAELRYIGR